MNTPDRSQREKFPKPRGWAMKWVIEEMDAQLAEQQTQEIQSLQESESRTGARRKFAEPQGWAMKWDGSALSEADKPRSGDR